MPFIEKLLELIFTLDEIFVLLGFILFAGGLIGFLQEAFFPKTNKEEKGKYSATNLALLCIIGLLIIIAFTFG